MSCSEISRASRRYDPTVFASLLFLEPSSRTLHSGLGPSLPPEWLAAIDGVVIGPNVGTCGAAAWSGQLTVSENLSEDPKWAPVREKAVAAGLGHCWSMPIKSATGEVLGTLALYGRRPRLPLPEQLAWLADWARLAGIAIERGQALGRLTHDARHDSLTGLPNRRAIFESLDEAIQRVGPEEIAAVLFIDLDGLKTLNDTLGHDRADEMIREVGVRLSDTPGAPATSSAASAVTSSSPSPRARRPRGGRPPRAGLLARLAAAARLRGEPSVTASIGIALIRTDTVEPQEAIRRSDTAMYEAKRPAGTAACWPRAPDRPGRSPARMTKLCAGPRRGASCRWSSSPSSS